MPDLASSLQGHDLSHLYIIAERWGVDFSARDARTGIPRLAELLLDSELVTEVVEALPADALIALEAVIRLGGRLPWSQFTRLYGEVREMGSGRRDRKRPDRHPASPAETLWYHALVARAFFDTPDGPQEFAYIPDDLIALLPRPKDKAEPPLGHPARPDESVHHLLVNDRILDHATTLLAALRVGITPANIPRVEDWPMPPGLLSDLLRTAGLLDEAEQPQIEAVRRFLEIPRGEAMVQLFQAWFHSTDFNELLHLPRIRAEGDWKNDPLRTRQMVYGFLSVLPKDIWWSLSAFVAAVKGRHPDFQRPVGDYDSWYLRDLASGEYLGGFIHWDEVDGALIRWMITGLMHWLGLVDLAASDAEAVPACFRLSGWADVLIKGAASLDLPPETKFLHVRSDGRLHIPRLTPRAVRFQLSRFCDWEAEKGEGYRYRLTPGSLARAREQSLRVGHLLSLLRKHARSVPPNIVQALARWDEHGVEARIEQMVVLRLSSPELLRELRTSRASRFLGDPLSPTAVIVKPGAWNNVLQVLVELGYLGEVVGEDTISI
ncbi:MAG: helicase-associated domain-containing protein [Chloroflexota bacterium]